MADLIESARGILSQTERRMAATANNVANITTPGFKSTNLYSEVSAETELRASQLFVEQRHDFSQGRLSKTGNPLDLAITGAGMFRLRAADGTVAYSRSGQFKLGDNGRVLNEQGLSLQTTDGGDLVLRGPDVRILPDGTVISDGQPSARVGIYASMAGAQLTPVSGSLFAIPDELVEEVASPELRQGMLEASNVDLASEMVSMMDALRQAEGGARLVQTYDELMGRAISTLGQGAR